MKTTIQLTAATLVLCTASMVHAEGGCPQGQVPYSGSHAMGSAESLASCGPIPTAAPAEIWASRWGAIASDGSRGVMGAVDSRSSKKQAERAAISECKSRGGVACSIQLSYYNQCVVTIQGSRTANNTRAATTEEATAIGMRTCTSQGDDDCKVYYKACSLPARTR